MNRVLVIGATSAIAAALAQRFAKRGDWLYLLSRNRERQGQIARDLEACGASAVDQDDFEANDFDAHKAKVDKAFSTLGAVDIVIIAHGTLPDQYACQNDFELTLEALNTNAISAISLMTHIANSLESQGHGHLAVITSVAGERGRQSNYIYGSAKGMLSIYLQGLRNRLYKSGIHVLDIKPGFVDTPMTAQFPKGLMWAQADTIARVIFSGIEKERDQIYAPIYWRIIMLIIRNIPEKLFKRLSL